MPKFNPSHDPDLIETDIGQLRGFIAMLCAVDLNDLSQDTYANTMALARDRLAVVDRSVGVIVKHNRALMDKCEMGGELPLKQAANDDGIIPQQPAEAVSISHGLDEISRAIEGILIAQHGIAGVAEHLMERDDLGFALLSMSERIQTLINDIDFGLSELTWTLGTEPYISRINGSDPSAD